MNWFFLAAALALLLWFFALLYLKSLIQRRTGADRILGLLQEEVRQLEADIDEKTEQNLQLLEEKIQALREICAEAERRIAVYGRELEKREKETQALTVLERGRAAHGQAAHGSSARDQAVYGPAANSPSARSPALPSERKRTGPGAKPARENTPSMPEKQEKKRAHQEGGFPQPRSPVPFLAGPELRDPALDAADSAYRAQIGQTPLSAPRIIVSEEHVLSKQPPVKDKIAELYRAGFSPELIAKRLRLTMGEVTVYINLCKLQGHTQGNTDA